MVIVSQIAVAYPEKHEGSCKDATSVLTEELDAVVQHVKASDKVYIAGLGLIKLPIRPPAWAQPHHRRINPDRGKP